MTKKKRIIKVGFDLDGVIIGTPPFVPKLVLEWLYRSHKSKKLQYRFPGKYEKCIRWLSHYPPLRRPLRINVNEIEKIGKQKRFYVVAISSRYGFLEKRTKDWLRYYNLESLFDETHLNVSNLQPHIFKSQIVKREKIDVLFDDDKRIISYLKKCFPKLKFVYTDSLNTSFSKKLDNLVD